MRSVAPVHPEIERHADEVLRKSGFPKLPNGIAVDVLRLAEEFYGLHVRYNRNLRFNGRPVLAAYIPGFSYLFVDRGCIPTRQRFSIAHELGHAELEGNFGGSARLFSMDEAFLCGHEEAVPTMSPPTERSMGRRRRREIRANQFAARILMPAALVKEVWRSGIDLRRMADALEVSVEALRYRAEELRLSNAPAAAKVLPLGKIR